jgi:hypothetical protein
MIKDTLAEREELYGDYRHVAYFTRLILSCMEKSNNWDNLHPYQQEALHMIVAKIARILEGNPCYIDSWHDIAGYATLVEKALKEEGS